MKSQAVLHRIMETAESTNDYRSAWLKLAELAQSETFRRSTPKFNELLVVFSTKAADAGQFIEAPKYDTTSPVNRAKKSRLLLEP
jgi:hypothetical protein